MLTRLDLQSMEKIPQVRLKLTIKSSYGIVRRKGREAGGAEKRGKQGKRGRERK